MKSVLDDINTGDFKQFYLFYGAEPYLITQYQDKLKTAFADGYDSSNINIFNDKNIDYKVVFSLADTPPFFAEKRLMIIKDEGLFSKKADDSIIKYLENPSPFTCFLFIVRDVNKTLKLYKFMNTFGRVIEFPKQDGHTLHRWIEKLALSENKRIEKSAAEQVIMACDSDMQKIKLETKKLFAYKLNEENIVLKDVQKLVAYRPENNVFSMMDAIAAGDAKRALKHYFDLIALNEPPMRILFLLGRHFFTLARVAELQKKGYNKEQMAKEAKIPPFALPKYISQVKALGKKTINKTLEMCALADEFIKTGVQDEKSAVELVIMQCMNR